MSLETKFAPLEAEVDEKGTIEGYASRFGIKDQGGDIVVKGAFADSIGKRAPKMLWQHDPAQPIGKWMDFAEDSTGLMVRGQINLDVQKGREAHALIKDGAIDGMSIGYRTRTAKNVKGARELRDLDLWEVSLVTFPMLKEATIDVVKSVHDLNEETPVEIKRFVEKLLREAEFSTDEAKAAAAAVAKVRAEREVMTEVNEADLVSDFTQLIRGLN